MLSLPSTAVGDGDGEIAVGGEPVGDGDELGWPGEAVGGAVPDADAVCAGEPGAGADSEDGAVCDGETNGDCDVTVAVGDVVTAAIAEGVALPWPGGGPKATGRGWAASTVAPTARSARRAAIGTMPIRLPSGRSSRQFGQKPETGVAT